MSERMVQQPPAQEAQAKFSQLPTAEIERSTFDMSHPWKGTMNAQRLVPCLTMEVLPGDTFNIKSTAFMRLATPLKPLMDGMSADIHYFFVPNRLVWDNWQFFMGERKNIDDDPTTVTVPQINIDLDVTNCSQQLPDYFGLPLTEGPAQASVTTLPFRAYAKIFNDWYRNQNTFSELDIPMDDGPDEWTSTVLQWYSMQFRQKKADYFVKALPFPQKGEPVFLPLGTSAPVDGTAPISGIGPLADDATTEADVEIARAIGFGGSRTETLDFALTQSASLTVEMTDGNETTNRPRIAADISQGTVFADLTEATAATINDIRTAFQIQRLLERDARSGTRYIEVLLAHFNVQSPDFRLQRAEYISGGSARIMINPVASTAETENAPQANLAATGTGLLQASMNHSFVEHGYLMGIISVRADLTYQNGLDRMWSRQTRYDYYWPALSHLGEQAIKNQELFFSGDQEQDEGTWAFQERYAEYRYQPGRVTGKFRSNDPESLDVWHLSEDFDELPQYNFAFQQSPPPIDRVVAVPSEPDFIVDIWHKISATRPMPIYAVPGLVDHF